MSDDLERAARAIHDTDFLAEFCTEEHYRSDPFYADTYSKYARAALLSFLDMDEAGVERMRLAVKAAFGASNHDELYEVEADEIARAVLAELRKMAGEKE